MNARDVIRDATREGYDEEAEAILDALCPPGTMRVIDRRPRPCPNCKGDPMWFGAAVNNTPPPNGDYSTCPECGGAGTVNTPTLRELEPAGQPFKYEPFNDTPWLYRLSAVGDTEGQAS